jgi:hypothetical protein
MVPESAVHVTSELYAPDPVTAARHCVVPPVEMFDGLQVTLTVAIVDVWEFCRKLAPPQPAIVMTPVNSKDRYNLHLHFI